jgi:hypothetical protein
MYLDGRVAYAPRQMVHGDRPILRTQHRDYIEADLAPIDPMRPQPRWGDPPYAAYAEFGFDEIYLRHVGKEQEEFIDAFGARVLPELS